MHFLASLSQLQIFILTRVIGLSCVGIGYIAFERSEKKKAI